MSSLKDYGRGSNTFLRYCITFFTKKVVYKYTVAVDSTFLERFKLMENLIKLAVTHVAHCMAYP